MYIRDLKDIIKLLVIEVENELNEEGGAMPANATPNISGYDSPFGPMMKRTFPRNKKKRRSKIIKK